MAPTVGRLGPSDTGIRVSSSLVSPILSSNTSRTSIVRPVNVVHVVQNLDTGGLEKLLVEMLRHTAPAAVQSRVLCIGQAGQLAADVLDLGVPLIALRQPPGRNLRLPLQLAHWFRRFNADVIHTHGPYAHLYGALGGWLSGRPVINTRHGYLWPWTRRRHLQNRVAGLLSSKIVAVSRNLAGHLHDVEKVGEKKLRLIYNGIDAAKFDTAIQPRRPHAPRAAMVSRLSPEKDFATLFRAVAIVGRQIPAFQMWIIGDGPLREDLRSLSEQLGVRDAVQFLGNRNDVAELLAEVNLFVLSSKTEGLSIALLEAMAGGLPVVATAVGGNPEVVVEGVTGFVVPPASPEPMAERMLWLLTHPDPAASMGEAGRKRIDMHFNICRTVNQYERLYLEMARSHQPAVGRGTRARG
jgi:glycosyltransferase involved in cell wall biosynthesis